MEYKQQRTCMSRNIGHITGNRADPAHRMICVFSGTDYLIRCYPVTPATRSINGMAVLIIAGLIISPNKDYDALLYEHIFLIFLA